jgi:hypothetical protein
MQDDPPTDDAENPGGSGGAPATDMLDLKLMDMAIREYWPMTPEARANLVKRLEEVVSNPETRPRAFHAATKALMTLSRINLTVVETALRANNEEDFNRRLASLEEKVKGAP